MSAQATRWVIRPVPAWPVSLAPSAGCSTYRRLVTAQWHNGGISRGQQQEQEIGIARAAAATAGNSHPQIHNCILENCPKSIFSDRAMILEQS